MRHLSSAQRGWTEATARSEQRVPSRWLVARLHTNRIPVGRPRGPQHRALIDSALSSGARTPGANCVQRRAQAKDCHSAPAGAQPSARPHTRHRRRAPEATRATGSPFRSPGRLGHGSALRLPPLAGLLVVVLRSSAFAPAFAPASAATPAAARRGVAVVVVERRVASSAPAGGRKGRGCPDVVQRTVRLGVVAADLQVAEEVLAPAEG
mmetsp:Transcript_11475/g.31464  ORF Transcript_11475/g.31464 Transcript_11475/m.31464 type:complete len:209 (+) Transcript_11475:34-660(+)